MPKKSKRPKDRSSRDAERNQDVYNEVQIDWIRKALRNYYKAEWDAKRVSSWQDLMFDIWPGDDEVTVDHLRQFALGKFDKRGRKRNFGSTNLATVVSFLIRPDVNAMSLDELKGSEIPYLLVTQLRTFLRRADGKELALPPWHLAGSFCAVNHSDSSITETVLHFKISENGQIVLIEEESETYLKERPDDDERPAPPDDFALWSDHDRLQLLDTRRFNRGWGILGPEDNLLAF